MGWVRYTLDREKVPYTCLRDEDLRAGHLHDRVDAIVYGPFARLDLAGQIHGIRAVGGRMPFEATPEHPSLGKPVESDDTTGPPGHESIRPPAAVERRPQLDVARGVILFASSAPCAWIFRIAAAM